jgi:rod shape determining protein RodA
MLFHNLKKMNKTLLVLMLAFVGLGLALLYDAAGGDISPWAKNQLIRFLIGIGIFLIIVYSPVQFWIKYAYSLYCIAVLLLLSVLVMGHIGMGAQRWLKIGPINIQPSEIMRVSLILSLACYFHRRTHEEIQKLSTLFVPLLMILIPAALVAKQPDLGTAIMIVASGVLILFIAGVPKRVFIISGGAILALIPVAWNFLHTYQKKRVLTFLNPERDPFGAGYHIMQSKIALGSGGIFGKGFMAGTQSHLNFLPEKQTDFIFTLFAEEFGFVGSLVLLSGYFLLIITGVYVGLRCQSSFCRLMAVGLSGTIFLYVFINIAMVIGLLPVVGVPLPFISYGGTAMWTLLISLGFIINADINKDQRLQRYY